MKKDLRLTSHYEPVACPGHDEYIKTMLLEFAKQSRFDTAPTIYDLQEMPAPGKRSILSMAIRDVLYGRDYERFEDAGRRKPDPYTFFFSAL